jgi:hypothetical protein
MQRRRTPARAPGCTGCRAVIGVGGRRSAGRRGSLHRVTGGLLLHRSCYCLHRTRHLLLRGGRNGRRHLLLCRARLGGLAHRLHLTAQRVTVCIVVLRSVVVVLHCQRIPNRVACIAWLRSRSSHLLLQGVAQRLERLALRHVAALWGPRGDALVKLRYRRPQRLVLGIGGPIGGQGLGVGDRLKGLLMCSDP